MLADTVALHVQAFNSVVLAGTRGVTMEDMKVTAAGYDFGAAHAAFGRSTVGFAGILSSLASCAR